MLTRLVPSVVFGLAAMLLSAASLPSTASAEEAEEAKPLVFRRITDDDRKDLDKAGLAIGDYLIVADAAMSLDNVLAVAGAAKGHMALVAIGIALSLPLVVFGSALLSMCMERWPWVIWLGGGVLGYVAGDMIMRDMGEWLLLAHGWTVAVAWTLGAVIAVLGWWLQRAERRGTLPGEA